MATLLRPAELTAEFHAGFLLTLRKALVEIPGCAPEMRVRDWDFVLEEGTPTVQVFLDKGSRPDGRPLPVSLDESMVVHRAWMECGLFDSFSDGVALEIGSSGVAPHLRDAADFSAQLGREVAIDLWLPVDGRKKLVGMLEAVGAEENVVVVRLPGERETIALELGLVRRAVVDLLSSPKRKSSSSS